MTTSVRSKIAELTADCNSRTDLDKLISRNGGLGGLFRAHFQGADQAEFMYEWDSRKLAIRHMTREK